MEKPKKGVLELADVNRELKKVVDSGKVLIGSKETIKALRRKEAKLILYASNCPEEIKRVFTERDEKGNGDLTIYDYPADSFELGLACGKPYPIASLCITNPGESEILRLLSPKVLPKGKLPGVRVRERYR
jgi:large subunit ribosomal protein L30e